MTAWHTQGVVSDASEIFDQADQLGETNMATKNFKFFLYQTPHGTVEEPHWQLTESKGMEEHGWALMGERVFHVALPKPEDACKIKLKALDIAEQKARADFALRITELQRMKNELLAIENTVEA